MDLLASLWNTLTYLPPFIAVLAVVVFVHEYGHYIVGRWCGIHAEVFSIGMGKPLLRWTDRRGTRWQIAALPIGGFVKFVGDMDPASAGRRDDGELTEEQRAVAFHNAAVWRRALTVAAGPVANFILSILVFAALAMVAGRASEEPVIGQLTEHAPADVGFVAGDRVLTLDGQEITTYAEILKILHKTDGAPVPATVDRGGDVIDITVRYSLPPVIDSISPGMPASRAGVLPGDVITAINGEAVHSFFGLQMATRDLPPETEITLGIDRAGEPLELSLIPVMRERGDPETGVNMMQPTIGVRSTSRGGLVPVAVWRGPLDALEHGVDRTWNIITGTLTFFGDMIFANADLSNIGGPIRIAEMSGEQAEQGAFNFVGFIAVLSTAIGLLNLMPIPILDGGHLMFYGIEALRGRPVGGSAMQVGTMIGLCLVLSLMVFATYNDISRVLAG
ncbi:RIP metalloprotease RseP [Paralimibaculum aggregatum]|uniref:Zinc metalloprotease n=1 Tax=Paralimibaculum aggregatum TaxID=3036245 RepID=A0ABQ6LK72_9RHOB|nr:RIP metalloprotease RseP [Limibaculum sp. NKW23]GMG83658.1 RIP metalloprotease RseP [Limibaculum sp. NKW23]